MMEEYLMTDDLRHLLTPTMRQLYEMSKTSDMPVLGHDGLPFNAMISASDTYYFSYVEDATAKYYDFCEFYEKSLPSLCQQDQVAGICEVHEADGVKWIGVDLFVSEAVKFEPYTLVELLEMARKKDVELLEKAKDLTKDSLGWVDPSAWAKACAAAGAQPVDF